VLAFYEFVRVADDIADHASMKPDEKLARLDNLEGTLLGRNDDEPQGVTLREVLRARGLSPVHAQHLLQAFRQDVTKLRYQDWDDLIDYCRFSAMPVGRFVCDVHGEPQSVWPANDALCAALQVINHIQDCAKDYRDLDRVYIPQDALAADGLEVSALREARASPALRHCLRGLVDRTAKLLEESRPFALQINDSRLAMEVAAIRREFGGVPRLVVPGVRPKSRQDDQKRTLDPAEAVGAGADIVVIGRPITAEPDPVAAARAIRASLDGVAGAA